MNGKDRMVHCILCNNTKAQHFFKDTKRDYFQCEHCNLIFVHPNQRISHSKEFERYELHQNSITNKGYVSFLNKIFISLQKRIQSGSHGLDFGSGPEPVLRTIFKNNGFKIDIFDYFYQPNQQVFSKQYDFITATEVLEHIHNPQKVLTKLWQCLKKSGYLGIMTGLVQNKQQFQTWYYKEDVTHIAFYSIPTFQWLENSLNASLTAIGNDIILLQKK